jgi:hypothetical protein
MSNINGDSSDVPKRTCGIIMPISAIDGCDENHWQEVLSILGDVIRSADFEPNMVSEAEEIGIIQKRIVQNVYNNKIVVCDVSGKNPNVMFELGMRLAFDKPTIIIKDDKTNYSFDTGVIEHLEYPRDLRYSKILSFKEKLTSKLLATYQMAEADPEFSTFLKSFGQFKIAQIETKVVSSETYILESLEELKREIRVLRRMSAKPDVSRRRERLSVDFYIKSSKVRARMRETEEGIVVAKGSQAIKHTSESISPGWLELRDALIASSALIDVGDFYEFSEDTVFASASAAASVILGRQAAGPVYWVDDENRTYKEFLESSDLE